MSYFTRGRIHHEWEILSHKPPSYFIVCLLLHFKLNFYIFLEKHLLVLPTSGAACFNSDPRTGVQVSTQHDAWIPVVTLPTRV